VVHDEATQNRVIRANTTTDPHALQIAEQLPQPQTVAQSHRLKVFIQTSIANSNISWVTVYKACRCNRPTQRLQRLISGLAE